MREVVVVKPSGTLRSVCGCKCDVRLGINLSHATAFMPPIRQIVLNNAKTINPNECQAQSSRHGNGMLECFGQTFPGNVGVLKLLQRF
jgi:hypothetical protein